MEGDILLAGSLAWIIIWSILGLRIGKQYLVRLDTIGKISTEGDLGKFWSTFDGFKMHVAAHAHAICFSSIAFALGLTMKAGLIEYSTVFLIILSDWLLAGILLSSVGDYFRSLPIVIPGNILFLTGLITSLIGLLI